MATDHTLIPGGQATAAEREPGGLTAAEVKARIQRGEVNRPPRSGWGEYGDILRRNVLTLFNALVVPAAIALFLLKEYQPAWAVSALALINSAIGLVQEIRAKRHLDRLALLAEARVRVLRDGAVCSVPAGAVVRDDHVLLAAGDPVVADGPVLAERFLEVDEALLTGESDPVPRKPGDVLLSGSYCVAGEGSYRAERVGAAAQAHQTAALARRYQFTASPLQRIIDRLIRILTAIAVGLCVLYGILYLVRDIPEADLVKMSAATLTSLVPQGLVLTATLAFTLGAVRLTTRGAVVQRLSAVESMAAVSVLCLDKTGTLTTNRLRVERLRVLNGAANDDEVRTRLRLFAWLSTDHRNRSILALRTFLPEMPGAAVLLDQVPFKSQNRYSAVRARLGEEEWLLALGAWEALRPFLGSEDAATGEVIWKEGLTTGLRLLLFAGKPLRGESGAACPPLQGELPVMTLRPLGLLALRDELRPGAGRVLEALAAQGIRIKIISGDHPETVRAAIAEVGMSLGGAVVTSGEELAKAADRDRLVRDSDVFGRVAPQQKVEVVTALQAQGHHVAMIGDGVNDVLCLKRADLGIAVGEGSSAARTVAGLVLENNDFALLPAALDEGRIILRNLRRTAKLFLLKNVYALLLIVGSLGVLGLKFPYEPQQVTLLNALTIGIPAFVITLSRRPPRGPQQTGFLREVGWFVLTTGLVVGVAGLTVFWLSARWLGDDVKTQRTLLLSTLVPLGVVSLWRVLRDGESSWRTDWGLRLLTLAALPVYAAVMYWPASADFFQLTPLDTGQWSVVGAVVGPSSLLCKLMDWVGPREK